VFVNVLTIKKEKERFRMLLGLAVGLLLILLGGYPVYNDFTDAPKPRTFTVLFALALNIFTGYAILFIVGVLILVVTVIEFIRWLI
jgi:NADH:ubiquinone oxidoreductase subunit 6 (subunit J)